MSLITIVKRNLKKAARNVASKVKGAAIGRLEEDIDWARASSDAHIRGLEQTLQQLRDEHDPRSTQEVERDVSRAAKAELFA